MIQLQYEFVRQISADPSNVVVGLVRDKAATEKKVAEDINRSNVHIVQADLADFDSLKVGPFQPKMLYSTI
jgi:hypothetical protein